MRKQDNVFIGDLKEALDEFEVLKEYVREIDVAISIEGATSLERLVVWSTKLVYYLVTKYPELADNVGKQEKNLTELLAQLRANMRLDKLEENILLKTKAMEIFDVSCVEIKKVLQ